MCPLPEPLPARSGVGYATGTCSVHVPKYLGTQLVLLWPSAEKLIKRLTAFSNGCRHSRWNLSCSLSLPQPSHEVHQFIQLVCGCCPIHVLHTDEQLSRHHVVRAFCSSPSVQVAISTPPSPTSLKSARPVWAVAVTQLGPLRVSLLTKDNNPSEIPFLGVKISSKSLLSHPSVPLWAMFPTGELYAVFFLSRSLAPTHAQVKAGWYDSLPLTFIVFFYSSTSHRSCNGNVTLASFSSVHAASRPSAYKSIVQLQEARLQESCHMHFVYHHSGSAVLMGIYVYNVRQIGSYLW